MAHNSETQSRIDRARMEYQNRASRRPVGLSRSDSTLYDENGFRRHPNETLKMRQLLAGVNLDPADRLLRAIFGK